MDVPDGSDPLLRLLRRRSFPDSRIEATTLAVTQPKLTAID